MDASQDEQIDLRGLAARAAYDGLQRMGAYLERDRLEDLVSFLTVVGVKASQRFDPSVGQARSTWVYRIQRPRIVDWYRTNMGDRRHSNPLLNPRSAVPYGPAYIRGLRAEEAVERDESLAETLDEMSERLTEEAQDTLRRVAVPLSAGYQPLEIARALGVRLKDVNERLERLQVELADIDEVAA